MVGVDAANMTARAMLERFTSDYGKNFINYNNPAYDALFQQAINAQDEATQTDLYKQMEAMLGGHRRQRVYPGPVRPGGHAAGSGGTEVLSHLCAGPVHGLSDPAVTLY